MPVIPVLESLGVCEPLADRLLLVTFEYDMATCNNGDVKTFVVVHKRRVQRKVGTHRCKDSMRGIKAI